MRAMVLKRTAPLDENPEPLVLEERPEPEPGPRDLLVDVSVCGVCHTELDEIEGRTPPPSLPVVPGHQVVGCVRAAGAEAGDDLRRGDRVGVAWIFSACGICAFCRRGDENLCDRFRATGRDVDGGYADSLVAPAEFVFRVPEAFSDAQAAPLFCAGAIGWRSLRLAEIERRTSLGLTGFGASGHLVLQLVRHHFPDVRVAVFARSERERAFARELGAEWTGDTRSTAPGKLDAIIDTTPAWRPVVEALRNLERGGRLVVNAIRKEDADRDALLDLDWERHLWLEKEVKSVANVSRRDVREFLELAAEIPIRPEVTEFPLEAANRAIGELRGGGVRGAKVLRIRGGE